MYIGISLVLIVLRLALAHVLAVKKISVPWRGLSRLARWLFLVAIICFAWWLGGVSPDTFCTLGSDTETDSNDRAYGATLLFKRCDIPVTLFYSVRIAAFHSPLQHGWFSVLPIDNDWRPKTPPVLHWDAPRLLTITVSTRTLSGSTQRHMGNDLVVKFDYIARSPTAFPNLNPN